MLVYPSGLDLSTSALRLLRRELAARRRRIGTRWRRLTCGRRALMALAHLRCGHTFAQLAAGFGVGLATAHRYVSEAVDVLAVLAPTLQEAMAVAARKAFVILDGTLLPIDRFTADCPFYSSKHRRHGMNVQVLTDPFGELVWASPALPGAVHDIKAARAHGLLDALSGSIPCWADKAYQGSGSAVRVPFRGRWDQLSAGKQAVNRAHAKIRALGEQAMAALKSWRLLRKFRCSAQPRYRLGQGCPDSGAHRLGLRMEASRPPILLSCLMPRTCSTSRPCSIGGRSHSMAWTGHAWAPHGESPAAAAPRWRGSSSVGARKKQGSSFRSSTTPVGRPISGPWTASMRGCSSTTATASSIYPPAYQRRESAWCDQTFHLNLISEFARRDGRGQEVWAQRRYIKLVGAWRL